MTKARNNDFTKGRGKGSSGSSLCFPCGASAMADINQRGIRESFMSDGTKIEWTDATWNPITGCSVVSPGCTNCYAMKLAGTRLRNHPSRAGLTQETKAGPVWNGTVRLNEEWLDQPLRWKRHRRIFVCAHGDLFHEDVPDEWIDRVFDVMESSGSVYVGGVWVPNPWHTFQVLTKRAERLRDYVNARVAKAIDYAEKFKECPMPEMRDSPAARYARAVASGTYFRNIWLGVSAEDQKRAEERIPFLLETSTAVRFVSAEPLLGPIDLTEIADGCSTVLDPECWGDCRCESLFGPDEGCKRNGGDGQLKRKIDWVIAGGESGPGARPMHPDWARGLRDQCLAAGVAFHFKQWGEWAPGECASNPPTRSEEVATWLGDRWSFDTFTPRASAELHCDDEPDLWRIGKKEAGRLLDGNEWNEFPDVRAA